MSPSLGSHARLCACHLILAQNLARRAHPLAGELADPAVEALVRLDEARRRSSCFLLLVNGIARDPELDVNNHYNANLSNLKMNDTAIHGIFHVIAHPGIRIIMQIRGALPQ